MTRKLIIMLCLAAVALGMNAQKSADARIKQIREAYANRLTMMQNQPYDDDADKVEQLTIAYNRMYPGTGLAKFKDTYYWTDDENEDYMLKPTLYYVTSHYTMNSGIYIFNREYLFDAETEEPMFMYVSSQFGEGGKKVEYRFYFDKGKLIKQIPEKIGPIAEDELEPGVSVDKNGKANAGYLLDEFESVKKSFHNQIPTYPW